MADKSPRHAMSKKTTKSIKDKRRDKRARASEVSQMERLTTEKGHHRSH
jgi:hypothetical protein